MSSNSEKDFDFIPDFDKLDELDNLPVMKKENNMKERDYVRTIKIEGEIEQPNSRCCVVEFESYLEKAYVNLTEMAYDELGALSKMRTVNSH